MATFRKIHTTFWSDSFTSGLDSEKKLFYLYLLTNERTSQCGIYEITKRQISFDLGYSMDTVSNLIRYFISCGKIRYNEATNEIALKNWSKYNISTSPKVQACVNKELKSIKDTVLIQYIYSMDTDPQEEEEKEKEKEKEEEDNIIQTSSNDEVQKAEDDFEELPEEKLVKKPRAPRKKKESDKESLFKKARTIFEARFQRETKEPYYWQAKDSGNMTSLLNAIKHSRSEKGMSIAEDDMTSALSMFLATAIKDEWIKKNLSVSILYSKYNEIVARAKQNEQQQKKGGYDERNNYLRADAEPAAKTPKDYSGGF